MTPKQQEGRMTEKRVKAWAVVDANGHLTWEDIHGDMPLIRRTEQEAKDDLNETYPGERVVQVEIVIKEGE